MRLSPWEELPPKVGAGVYGIAHKSRCYACPFIASLARNAHREARRATVSGEVKQCSGARRLSAADAWKGWVPMVLRHGPGSARYMTGASLVTVVARRLI